MKRFWRETIALILTIAMSMSIGIPAFAEASVENENVLKNKVADYVQNWVNDNYTEHYMLSDYESQFLNFDLQDNKLEAHLLVEMKTKLKYNSVEELPYMQGVKELVGVNSVENLLLNTTATENTALKEINGLTLSDTQKMNFVQKISQQYEDAFACIGVDTPLTVDFVLKADVINSKLSNIRLFEEIEGKLFPAEPFNTSAELK